MKLDNFNLPNLMPDASFINEIEKHTQELLDSITPLNKIIAEEIKPVLEENRKVDEGINDNYRKLSELYLLKEKEVEVSKEEAEKSKKYNTKMLIIALVSAGIAIASLVVTIVIAVL